MGFLLRRPRQSLGVQSGRNAAPGPGLRFWTTSLPSTWAGARQNNLPISPDNVHDWAVQDSSYCDPATDMLTPAWLLCPAELTTTAAGPAGNPVGTVTVT